MTGGVSAPGAGVSSSIYMAVRRGHPQLPATRLHKCSLVVVTTSLEALILERAQAPVLFGAFQRAPFLDQARSRWDRLAAIASSAVVFTDAPRSLPGPLVEVSAPPDSALRWEWAVVCVSPTFHAVLAAWEIPLEDVASDAERLFECVWSVDAAPALTAAAHCAGLAGRAGGGALVLDREADDPDDPDDPYAVFARMLGALDEARCPHRS